MSLIYIAEDDASIRELLVSFLTTAGYDIEAFETGDALYEAFQQRPPHLIVLDVMMPGTDGFTICKNIRETSTVPIIVLTAKDSELDYVQGITLGSDDYLTKPFRPTVLMMRIKALLRRVEMERTGAPLAAETTDVTFGPLRYVEEEQTIYHDDAPLPLTPTERHVLVYFMARPKKAISRDALLQNVWGFDASVETRVTDETVRRLRKKMIAASCTATIQSVWGVGYQLIERGTNG